MKYKIKQETKPTLKNFGKYKAVAVHEKTIESEQIIKETALRTGFSTGNIKGVLISIAEVALVPTNVPPLVSLKFVGFLIQ